MPDKVEDPYKAEWVKKLRQAAQIVDESGERWLSISTNAAVERATLIQAVMIARWAK